MREKISEYIELSESEKEKLWKQATFVFDTNVYLNLYRYSKKTREVLIAAMQQLANRIWMPNHVAHEFMKHRHEIIYESANQYRDLHNDSQKFFDTCTKTLRFKDDDVEYEELHSLVGQIDKWLDEIKRKNLLVENGENDSILNKLLDLYEEKVGVGFNSDELKDIKTEGRIRYTQKVPPGYKDAQKIETADDNNAFGDLIIWKEILQYAKTAHKDIIYVTHDQKEDWWNIIHGVTIGPRIELRKEFINSTNQKFHMYNMTSFIQRVKMAGGEDIDESVINEVHRNSDFDLLEQYFNALNNYNKQKENLCIDPTDSNNELMNKIKTLEVKNLKRKKMINSQHIKYYDRDIPENIREQIRNAKKNYDEAEAQIDYFTDRLKE